jgi:hypothetical protein
VKPVIHAKQINNLSFCGKLNDNIHSFTDCSGANFIGRIAHMAA